MKKFLTLAFAAIAAMTNAQYRMNNYNGNEGQNDVKINMLSLFFYGTEFGYERILNPNVGIGGSVMIPYGDNIRLVIKSNLNYYVSPYIRYYFNGFGPASGFFVEGFGLLSDGKYTPRDENGISADTKKNIRHSAQALVSVKNGQAVPEYFWKQQLVSEGIFPFPKMQPHL
ncbi:hypothetical protein AAH994_03955 [Weeksellaceae bacterium A-14]